MATIFHRVGKSAKFRDDNHETIGLDNFQEQGYHKDTCTICEKDSEYISDLVLQMTLYFNLIFLPIWFVFIIYFAVFKLDNGVDSDRNIIIVLLSIEIIFEIPRVLFGYRGNLLESKMELFIFTTLSLTEMFFHITVTVLMSRYQFYDETNQPVIRWVAHPTLILIMLIMAIFILIGFIFAIRTIVKLQKHQSVQWYLRNQTQRQRIDRSQNYIYNKKN
ncbi:hypothetical protein SNEBB_004059 [Seison nebaliae]|nr:hypothetical protein SNEBB_004059 [Seison nebaliae]